MNHHRNLFDLSAPEVFYLSGLLRKSVGSYPTFSPLPFRKRKGGFLFCSTVCTPRLPEKVPCYSQGRMHFAARTFLPSASGGR